MLEAVPDLLFYLDREGRFLDFVPSRELEPYLQPGDFLGRTIGEVMPEELAASLASRLSLAIDTGEPQTLEYVLPTQQGARQEFEARFVPMGPDRALAMARNITERRLLEEKLQASQRLDALGKLAGGVAHDFNNILAVIAGCCDIALEELPPEHPVRADVLEIREAGRRGADLTRQLLAFGRREPQQAGSADANQVLETIEPMLRRLLGEDVDLRVRLSSARAIVPVDSTRLEQIVLNLAVNARDAMPSGGTIVVELGFASLDGAYDSTEADTPSAGLYVVLAVTDTGRGMGGDTRARLFEPFFTTKPKGQGTGLGLSTVYGIVKQCGGGIAVFSEPGRGTCMKVYLPAGEAHATVTAPSQPEPETVGGSETILLVEDDAALRVVTCRLLERAGYTVLSAAHPEAARLACTQHGGPVHLLLTDVILPGMSGPEMYRLCGEDPGCTPSRLARCRPRVLFTSGYSPELMRERAGIGAGTPVIAKPFSGRELLAAVRRALEADAAGSELPILGG